MRKPRIIIIEDDTTVLRLLEKYFKTKNYDVVSFSEPVSCPIYEHQKELCDRQAPCADLAIIDYHLPRMNGLDLIKEQSRIGCPLPVRQKAIISCYVDEQTQGAIAAFGLFYINKPFRLAELNEWLFEMQKGIDLSKTLAPVTSLSPGERV